MNAFVVIGLVLGSLVTGWAGHAFREWLVNVPEDLTKTTHENPTPLPAGSVLAHQWIKKQREDISGPMRNWNTLEMDNYHRDLGILVDFVTDCWPIK